jgi:hypothetical protein
VLLEILKELIQSLARGSWLLKNQVRHGCQLIITLCILRRIVWIMKSTHYLLMIGGIIIQLVKNAMTTGEVSTVGIMLKSVAIIKKDQI